LRRQSRRSERDIDSAAAAAIAIEFRGIDKWFGAVHANRDVSLTVRAGTIHGVVG
jgi:simple sugar transport system ATP-binding protein